MIHSHKSIYTYIFILLVILSPPPLPPNPSASLRGNFLGARLGALFLLYSYSGVTPFFLLQDEYHPPCRRASVQCQLTLRVTETRPYIVSVNTSSVISAILLVCTVQPHNNKHKDCHPRDQWFSIAAHRRRVAASGVRCLFGWCFYYSRAASSIGRSLGNGGAISRCRSTGTTGPRGGRSCTRRQVMRYYSCVCLPSFPFVLRVYTGVYDIYMWTPRRRRGVLEANAVRSTSIIISIVVVSRPLCGQWCRTVRLR